VTKIRTEATVRKSRIQAYQGCEEQESAARWVLFSVALSDQLRKTGSGNPHLLCKCSLMIAEQPAAEICDIVPELESYAY
jgi:hypothetical protein